MPKSFSGLPRDVSSRLDDVIARSISNLRSEIQHIFRFANMSEVEAAILVLNEKGAPLHVDAIVEELKGGGLWRRATGAKGSSAHAEMRRAISQAATHKKNLKFVDREKEIIGLAHSQPNDSVRA
jgi:hypothetical protein